MSDYEIRFWAHVDKTSNENGCWEWTSALAKNGYGVFRLNRKTIYAHRLAYAISGNDLDSTLVLDHLCRNRKCVNPSHIEQITRGENVRRGIYLNGYCKRGHSMSYTPSGRAWCRECQQIRRSGYKVNKSNTQKVAA